MTLITTPVPMAGMDELDQKHRALVERVRGYPMTQAARAGILAEIEDAYCRERAWTQGDLPGIDLWPLAAKPRI